MFGIKTMHVTEPLLSRFSVIGTRRDPVQYNLPKPFLKCSFTPPIEETSDSVFKASKSNMPPRKSLDMSKAATGDEGTPAKEGSVREGVNIEVCN